jgi:glycosyltransferase involved in cell wall biosynthesis
MDLRERRNESMSRNPSVICVTDYFLPGHLGGGPIRTLANMRNQLSGEVNISVFTRDRDLGDTRPYPDCVSNSWIDTAQGPVYYADPTAFGPRGFKQALRGHAVDIVYLNSFFSPRASVLLYAARKMLAPNLPFLIAPRGEFSPGALALKQGKKAAFIRTARLLGLYRDAFWHASTDLEADDILTQFPSAVGRVFVAPDPVAADLSAEAPVRSFKPQGTLRLAFVSRISPKKNLLGLLEILRDVNAQVSLDIFGPVEDQEYWARCETRIAQLPENVEVRARGTLPPEEVSSTFARHDLFAFPTLGENFGHVIFEALRAGTPVLVSDRTPWKAAADGAVRVLPLEDREAWKREIERAAALSPEQQRRLCRGATAYAMHYLSNDPSRLANQHMFQDVLSQHRRSRGTA